MTPIVFLDTETTGLHPDTRQVWEVGMIRRDDNGERETQFFLEVDLALADPFALKVGGFYQRHPQGRWLAADKAARVNLNDDGTVDYYTTDDLPRTPAGAARAVAQWTHGAHIVGAVPGFDMDSLGKLLREHGLTPAWHYHLIDVENLAVGALAVRLEVYREALKYGVEEEGVELSRPTQESVDTLTELISLPWDSEALGRELGVQITEEDRHTALGDARWAKRMYDAVMR